MSKPVVLGWVILCVAHSTCLGLYPSQEVAQKIIEENPDAATSCESTVLPLLKDMLYSPPPTPGFLSLN